MNAPAAALLLGLAIAFQGLALPLYRVGSIGPDFPFLALAYLAFFATSRQILAAGAGAAVAIDLLSLDPLGTRLAGYLPALWILNRFRRGFFVESMFLRALLTLAACSLTFGLEGLFLAWKEGIWQGPSTDVKMALYTALLGVGVHAALDRCRARLGWARDRFF